MDNSNNPNWPNNPLPSGNPVNPPIPPTPQPDNPPTFPQNPPSDWTPPPQPSPLTPTSSTDPLSPQQPPATPEFPPISNTQWSSTPQPATSPLDNPWNAPVQPPPINGPALGSMPTWTPPAPDVLGQAPTGAGPSPVATEPAPTDLSHLISNNTPAESASANTPETLVMPATPSSAPDVPTIPIENHKGVPIWLIGVGMGLLVIVLGVSAYFILGFGQPGKETVSLPAQISKTTVSTPPPMPAPPPPAVPAAAATGSADFGQLEDTPPATSAADLLRRR